LHDECRWHLIVPDVGRNNEKAYAAYFEQGHRFRLSSTAASPGNDQHAQRDEVRHEDVPLGDEKDDAYLRERSDVDHRVKRNVVRFDQRRLQERMELFGAENFHDRFDYADSEGPQKQNPVASTDSLKESDPNKLGIAVKTIIDTPGT
jgi:hypothetical protein